MGCTQRDRMANMVAGYKGKGSSFGKYPFCDWEPAKLFEKWCNMFIFVFVFFCEKRILLHDFEFFEGGTLIRSDVNE